MALPISNVKAPKYLSMLLGETRTCLAGDTRPALLSTLQCKETVAYLSSINCNDASAILAQVAAHRGVAQATLLLGMIGERRDAGEFDADVDDSWKKLKASGVTIKVGAVVAQFYESFEALPPSALPNLRGYDQSALTKPVGDACYIHHYF